MKRQASSSSSSDDELSPLERWPPHITRLLLGQYAGCATQKGLPHLRVLGLSVYSFLPESARHCMEEINRGFIVVYTFSL